MTNEEIKRGMRHTIDCINLLWNGVFEQSQGNNSPEEWLKLRMLLNAASVEMAKAEDKFEDMIQESALL